MIRMLRRENGQALIVVALAIVAVLGALALALDWGYGLTQRRVSQNAADAAAIAAARTLATNTALVNGTIAFRVSEEYLFCVATQYATANRATFLPTGATSYMALELGVLADPNDRASAVSWAPVAPAACPAAAVGTDVPTATRFVRAISSTSYRSLIAAVVGQPTVQAQASARAEIAGGAMGDGPVWPLVRHYNPAAFDAALQCGKPPCDPQTTRPFTFWVGQGSLEDMVYENFKGLVDFSRYSDRAPAASKVGQLITSWDQTGSPAALPAPGTPRKPDQSGNCGGPWDTQGNEDPQQYDKSCSIPNWAYYTFGGKLSLTSDWWTDATGAQEKPGAIGTRDAICPPAKSRGGLPAPSCDEPRQGDWVETALTGDLGNNVSEQLLAYINAHPTTGPLSATYGPAVVIYVYLWDCAETFDKSRPAGDQWSVVTPKKSSDCSQLKDGSGVPSIDRVHLFTAAPFTFYRDLVSKNSIRGFWGGGFGDPAACEADRASCPRLNPFINTAFLVPDDD